MNMASTLNELLRGVDELSRYAKSNYRSTSKAASRKYEDASDYAGDLAAEALESAAQIARGVRKNAAAAQGQVGRLIQDRPVGTLLLAVAVGVMIGFAARR
jgi:ElaB/YqjD/DUF883 family membrane-anchored ribosome-binding protein